MFALLLPNAPAVFQKMRTPHSIWAHMLAMTPLPFKKIVAAHSTSLGAAECEHNLLVPNQVHGDHVVTVTSNGADDLENIREQIAEGCDAIVCMAREVPVMLCFADCVPVVLVAPGGFAVVHSGWKGTIARISAKACQALCEAAGCKPDDISAYTAISWATSTRCPKNLWIALLPSSRASMPLLLVCSIFPPPFARR